MVQVKVAAEVMDGHGVMRQILIQMSSSSVEFYTSRSRS